MSTPTTIPGVVALVTGSNRGIGRALVEALLARGAAKVYATARNTDSLADLAASSGGRLVPVPLDVTNAVQLAAVAHRASDATLVINNAGVALGRDLFAADLATARQEFEVNYWGTLNVIRAFAPTLRAGGGGTIANVSSVAGLVGFPGFPNYSDTKAAVHSLTTHSRLTLAGDGVRVVGVYPGPVDTDMAKGVDWAKATPASVATAILDGIEAGAEEIFPDPMAEGFAAPYEAGHKTLERRIASMFQPA